MSINAINTTNATAAATAGASLKKLRLIALACMLVFATAMIGVTATTASAKTTTKVTKVVKIDNTRYYKDAALSVKSGALAYYGTELVVLKTGSTASKVKFHNGYRYVKNSALAYPKAIATGPSQKLYTKPSSSSASKGFVIRGQEMTVLNQTTVGSTKYLKVTVDCTYTGSLGNYKKYSTKQTGYIKKSNTDEASKLVVTNKVVTMYERAKNAVWVPSKTFGLGNTMELIMSNKNWAKVKSNGKTWYCDPSQIEPLYKSVVIKSLTMRKTAATDSETLGTYYWNKDMKVLREQSINGAKYALVESDGGKRGWMCEKTAGGTTYLGYTKEMHAIDNTYLYSTANPTAKPSTDIPKGTRVTILAEGDPWTKVSMNGETGFAYTEDLAYPTATISCDYFTSGYNCAKGEVAGTFDEEEVEVMSVGRSVTYALVRTASGKIYWIDRLSLVPENLNVTGLNGKSTNLYVGQTYIPLYYKPNKKAGFTRASYCDKIIYLDSYLNEDGIGWVEVVHSGKIYYAYQDGGDALFMAKLPKTTYGTNAMQKAVCNYAVSFVFDKKTIYNHKLHCGHGEIDSKGRYNFHCSGFIAYVFNKKMKGTSSEYGAFNWNITTSCKDLENVKYLDKEKHFKAKKIWDKRKSTGEWDDNLQPGDVLLFERGDNDDYMDHVAMYIGGGLMVHCTSAYDFDRCVLSKTEGAYGSEGNLMVVMRYLPENVDLLA